MSTTDSADCERFFWGERREESHPGPGERVELTNSSEIRLNPGQFHTQIDNILLTPRFALAERGRTEYRFSSGNPGRSPPLSTLSAARESVAPWEKPRSHHERASGSPSAMKPSFPGKVFSENFRGPVDVQKIPFRASLSGENPWRKGEVARDVVVGRRPDSGSAPLF